VYISKPIGDKHMTTITIKRGGAHLMTLTGTDATDLDAFLTEVGSDAGALQFWLYRAGYITAYVTGRIYTAHKA
jgi:hypothetical protein